MGESHQRPAAAVLAAASAEVSGIEEIYMRPTCQLQKLSIQVQVCMAYAGQQGQLEIEDNCGVVALR